MSSATQPTLSAATRLTGRKLRFARYLWMALVAGALLVFISGLPVLYEKQVNLPPETLAQLEAAGLPSNFAAIFRIVVDLVTLAAFASITLLLFWRCSDDWLAMLTGLMFLLTAFIYTGSKNTTVPLFMWLSVFFIALGETLQVTFFYVFPDGKFTPRWSRWIIPPLFIFRFIIWGRIYTFSLPQGALEVGIVVLLLVIGLVNQLRRYRKMPPVQRQQIKFLLASMSFTIAVVATYIYFVNITGAGATSNWFVQQGLMLIRQFALLVVPIALAFSILRFKLWDIDLTINRSLVYGIVTIGLGIVFVASVFVLQSLLGSANTIPALIISAIGPAVLFNPTRKRVRHFIDRKVYGFKFDLYQLRKSQKPLEITNPGAMTGLKLDHYELLDVIGKGGMGEVYKSYNGKGPVAIKILPWDLAKEEEYRVRFEREARIGMTLEHPNIARVYSSGLSENTHYMAMELIDGVELSDFIKQKGPLLLEDACDVLRGITAALDYAHARGLVHRDMKASNIMLRLSKDGERYDAVVMDFGVAKLKDAESSYTGSNVVGSIDYMAPEQIMSAQTVDHRADIYALGVVTFEMLTGQRPFRGAPAQVMFAQIQQPPPDPRDLNPAIPRHVAHAILRSLQKSADDRFNSAGEFLSAIVAIEGLKAELNVAV